MLGPLPTLYRVTVAAVAFLAFVGLGSWAAHVLPESVTTLLGTGIGAGLGVAVVILLLGDRDHDPRSRVGIRSPRH